MTSCPGCEGQLSPLPATTTSAWPLAPAATRTGQLLDSCGTAEGMVRAVEPLAGPALGRVIEVGLSAGWHTLPGMYALLGGQMLGKVLDLILALLGVADGEPFATLDRQARGVPAGTLRLVQEHPYSAPSIVGIGTGASPAALWSAALGRDG